MTSPFNFELDRNAKTSLTEQIRLGICTAIENGVLLPGARLPSWRDLAAQLGVSRGTVKTAYERLSDAQLIVSSRANGTHIANHLPKITIAAPAIAEDAVLPVEYQGFATATPPIFRMGIPAPDCFPTALFSRIRARSVRAEMATPAMYPSSYGEQALRREIAAHLALSRGIDCQPSQIVITAGFSSALGIITRVLQTEGQSAWVENPGFPPSRRALEFARLTTVAIPVDNEGLNVSYGLEHAPDAALALVTAGQQAPLGVTLSLSRRHELLAWAEQKSAWIIEDDYLGELQLKRRAAPALTSLDRAGRVIYVGSFSKTISPTLRLGFLVSPPALVQRFVDATVYLAPAPGPAVQLATAEFMHDGHYMRHLRRMKRIYASRGDKIQTHLAAQGFSTQAAGLAILLSLPAGTADTAIANNAAAYNLAPNPLSAWYYPNANVTPRASLLLNVATANDEQIPDACNTISKLIKTHA